MKNGAGKAFRTIASCVVSPVVENNCIVVRKNASHLRINSASYN